MHTHIEVLEYKLRIARRITNAIKVNYLDLSLPTIEKSLLTLVLNFTLLRKQK